MNIVTRYSLTMAVTVFLPLTVGVMALLAGCAPKGDGDGRCWPAETTDGLPCAVVRFIDDEAGIVCWRYTNNPGGLSCLPLADTRLDQ